MSDYPYRVTYKIPVDTDLNKFPFPPNYLFGFEGYSVAVESLFITNIGDPTSLVEGLGLNVSIEQPILPTNVLVDDSTFINGGTTTIIGKIPLNNITILPPVASVEDGSYKIVYVNPNPWATRSRITNLQLSGTDSFAMDIRYINSTLVTTAPNGDSYQEITLVFYKEIDNTPQNIILA